MFLKGSYSTSIRFNAHPLRGTTSAVERSPNDGLQGLFVRGILHFTHIASGAVRLEREKLLFERVE